MASFEAILRGSLQGAIEFLPVCCHPSGLGGCVPLRSF